MCNDSSRAISSATYVPAVACSEAEDYDVTCNSQVTDLHACKYGSQFLQVFEIG